MKEKNYMSKEYTTCVRGICALLVVVHHLYQYTGLFWGTFIGDVLQSMGYLCVAVFFFYSGYGLMLSSSKDSYIESFFRKRFFPLYSFYVVLIILYSLWTLLIEKQISIQNVVQSFFFGETVVTNGWYLQATFVAYLLYYLCFKILKTYKMKIFSFSIGIIAYIILCYFSGLHIHWYQAIPCMLLGVIYCYKNHDIDVLLKKRTWLMVILSGVFFGICFGLSIWRNTNAILNALCALLFVCFVVSLSYVLYNTPIIKNKFFKLCGKYSLEIYVSHGFFLRLIKLGYIENIYIYIMVVTLCTTLISFVMKKINTRIAICWQKINKKTHPSK